VISAAIRLGLVLVALVGCSHPAPRRTVIQSFANISSPTDLAILSISYSANQTNVFRCEHPQHLNTWSVASNACPVRVDLIFIGPESSNCVIEFQPELGWPKVIIPNAWNEGQGWCEVSPTITLTGAPQTFSTGAIDNRSSFYRARLK